MSLINFILINPPFEYYNNSKNPISTHRLDHPLSLSARVITKNNRSRFFQVDNGLVEGKLI